MGNRLKSCIIAFIALMALAPWPVKSSQATAWGVCSLKNYRSYCSYNSGNLIGVTGGGSYLFSTFIQEKTSLDSTNNALFTVELFDAARNPLGQSVRMERMVWSDYLGGKWYSNMNGGTSYLLEDNFQPVSASAQNYKKVVVIPVSAAYARIRVYNLGSVTLYSALTTFSKLNYLSEGEVGVKGMGIFYFNTLPEILASNGIEHTAARVFLSYLARRNPSGRIVDKFFDGMILLANAKNHFRVPGYSAEVSHLSMVTWGNYLDILFDSMVDTLDLDGDSNFAEPLFDADGSTPPSALESLNEAAGTVKTAIGEPDYKVKFFVTIPIPIEGGDTGEILPPLFGNVDGYAGDESFGDDDDEMEIIGWFIHETLNRWDRDKHLYPHLELGGFYFNDEYPLAKNKNMAYWAMALTRPHGLKLIHSPYRIKNSNTPTSFRSSYFNGIYVQPHYFPDIDIRSDSTIPVLATMMLYPGLNHGGINLEWTGYAEGRAILPYLDIVRDWDIADQVSFMTYDNGGRIYLCDPANRYLFEVSFCRVDGRDIYQEIADVLGRSKDPPNTIDPEIPIDDIEGNIVVPTLKGPGPLRAK
ncbi:MAG: DUF4855 domain-containing protein [Deltaproteobacteria bacterium]|nr:DUF4855 domain-containing protein [Deltaproteobacteria bacterium]